MNLTVQCFLRVLDHAGARGVTEVCVAPGSYDAKVGYFEDVERAVTTLLPYDRKANVYFSLNPVNPALLARANNRLIPARNRTTDADTWRDCWLLVDVDPVRPTGISSTQEELDAALEVLRSVYAFLLNAGVPARSTVVAMSGNGAYLLIRLLDYEPTPERIESKKQFLSFLSDLFTNERVQIDRKVFNPSRLIGAVGTVKCKGDAVAERPHRRSEILSVGGAEFDPSREQHVEPFDLYALAAPMLPKKRETQTRRAQSNGGSNRFDIREYIDLLEGYHETQRGWAHSRCPSHQGSGQTSFFVNTHTGAYGCFSGCTPEQIRAALGVVRPSKTFDTSAHDHMSASSERPDVRVIRLADVTPEKVKWLWWPRIPFGKLTMIEGDPGLGKSWLTCAIAAAVAQGRGLYGAEPTEPRNALMLSAEDGLADTIRPRLDSMRADVSRIFALDEAIVFDDAGLLRVEVAICEYKPAIVTVDPLVAYLGAGVDMHRANEIRQVMAALARIADKYQCAIVAVRHLTKSAQDRPIYRGIGSIDFVAACRSVLLVGADPNDRQRRALIHIKSNLAEMGESVGYEIRNGSFFWTGPSDLTAECILAPSVGEKRRTGAGEAEDFLQEALRFGPRPSEQVQKDARVVDISEWNLRKARRKLGIKPRKVGQPGDKDQQWLWELPNTVVGESQGEIEDAEEKTSAHLRANPDEKDSKTAYLPEDEGKIPSPHLRDDLPQLRRSEKAACDSCGRLVSLVDGRGTCDGCGLNLCYEES